MKLRNKKTGGLANMLGEQGFIRVYTDAGWEDFGTLAELNEYWEDYGPKESLIKDEKIRKAVRAWAEANRTKYVWVSTALKGIHLMQDFEHLQLTEYKQSITFECEADFKSGNYTIAELCGEEEE